MIDMYEHEKRLKALGYTYICGTDEAGRGPVAGPVVAASVILDPNNNIEGLDDSKKLTPKRRKELLKEIKEKALAIGVSFIYPEEIDEINVLEASRKAMAEAINNLNIKPDYILTDYMDVSVYTDIPFLSLTKGDQKSASIAAASIVAKEKRDAYMVYISKEYPLYEFEKHKGYPTKRHLELIEEHGITQIHRKSFKPIKKHLK